MPISDSSSSDTAPSAPIVRAESPTFIFSTPTARAGVLDVHDRDPSDARILQYDLAADSFLAGQQPAERIADIRRLKIRRLDARIVQGTPDCRIGDRLKRLLHEAAGRMGADADDPDLAHHEPPCRMGIYL